MKKLVSLLLVLLMIFPAAFAQSKVVSDEPVTLRYTLQEVEVAGCSYADPLPVFKAIEERTGVTIEWDVIPADYATVMSTRVAAMTDLPDIMQNPNLSLSMLVSGNIAARLNEYVDEHGPNISKQLELNPAIAAEMYAPDGGLYLLPTRVFGLDSYSTNPMTFIIRYDWLKKVGLDAPPTTIDEWHDTLTAFREKDPNGNGEKDETPFCASLGMMNAFSEAWGLDPLSYFNVDADGRVYFQWNTQAARDFLATMHQWYEEGLIAPDYLTDRNIDARHLENQTGASYMWSASNCDWQNTNNTDCAGVDWRPILPPKNVYTGEDGFVTVLASSLYGGTTVITDANGKADLAVRWVDYLWSDEGILYTNMGIEGETYFINDKGEPAFLPEFWSGDWYQKVKSFGIDPGRVTRVLSILYSRASSSNYSDVITQAAAAVLPYVQVSLPEYPSSEEEDLIMSMQYTDIQTYVDEMLNKFIVGSEPIDGFEAFAAKLDSMGLADVVAVKQAQYDRNN